MRKRIVLGIVLLFNALFIYSENINGIVVCSTESFPIQGANISIFCADSLIYDISTDYLGRFEISLAKGIYRIQVKKERYLTLEDSLSISTSDESRELKLILEKEPIILDEVVVKASPLYIKNQDDGIIYNLSKDKYAQKDNLLNALNRVPLLMVNSDGTINVAGKSHYVVYLNGKPYSIANADPAQVLRGIPSSNIKQVEVIMRPAQRFGESIPVINIITKGNSIEGYHININGLGATTPKAKGAASVLGVINRVQFFAGYTYDLWGQRDQQWIHEYKYSSGINSVTSSDKNRMNKHTHLGRTMFQWDVDTLCQLYADFHINGIERNEKIYYGQYNTTAAATSSKYLSISDTWDATMEANIIYSSQFKKSNAQKWRIGYRFTLNPDNRNYRIEELSINSTSDAKTKGRLYTHNFQLFRRVNFTKRIFSLFTLNANLRRGTTISEYVNEPTMDNVDNLEYTQIIGSLDWNMIWYITKSNDLWFDINNRLEYANDESTDLDSRRQSFSYLPTLKLKWQPNWDNEFSMAFTSRVNRPSLQMLNPFIGGKTDNDVLQGSPELNNAKTYSLSLGYSFYGKKVSVSPTVSGSFTRNAIMSVFDSNETSFQVIETYSNISKMKMLSLELYLSYRPWQWMTLRNVSSLGIQNIASSKMSLNQSDGFYRSTSVMSLNLPSSWQFEASFTSYKHTPKAWVRYEPGVMYGFSLSKTLMNGNMFVKAFLDSPFDKHGVADSRTTLSSPGLSYNKLWRIQTRSVGIEVSINLRGGKKVGLKRNTSLKDTDIRSGISN